MTTGQKVVCIDDKFHPEIAKFYIDLPKLNVVYVIRSVCVGISPNCEVGEVCLHLIGLNNPKSETPPFPERGFNAERFRPLDELKKENEKEVVWASGVEQPQHASVF